MKVVLDTNVLLISLPKISPYRPIFDKLINHKIEPYFKWNLIKQDKDDNKFVDCALAGGADFIVTNDKHFDELNEIDFPKIKIISADEFLQSITQND